MSEELTANGKIDSCTIATREDGTQITGKRSNGEDYTCYKYKIGGKYYSGFDSVEDYNLKRGDYCIVAYKEEPNKDPKKKPYKNIINITQAAAPEGEVKEEGEQPKAEITESSYSEGAFFGMVSNQTIQWLVHKNIDIKHESFKSTWNQVFDKFWDLNIAKRQEKLK